MHLRHMRFLVILNALLTLVILVLLACLWSGRCRFAAGQTHIETKTAPDGAQSDALREIGVVHRVGIRAVSFTCQALPPDPSDGWRQRGMQPQEWARLPASPGMDMTETPDNYLLNFSLPGVSNNDIHLSMTGRVVSIQAVVRDARGHEICAMERRVLLPRIPGDSTEFKAHYTNGVLRVCVGK